jgi:hypothetical protein
MLCTDSKRSSIEKKARRTGLKEPSCRTHQERGSSTGGTDISETEPGENGPSFEYPAGMRRAREPSPPIRPGVEKPHDFAPESFHRDNVEAEEEEPTPENHRLSEIVDQHPGSLFAALTEDDIEAAGA